MPEMNGKKYAYTKEGMRRYKLDKRKKERTATRSCLQNRRRLRRRLVTQRRLRAKTLRHSRRARNKMSRKPVSTSRRRTPHNGKDTRLATLRRPKQEGWTKRERSSLVQSPDGRNTEGSRKEIRRYPRKKRRKGSFLTRMGGAAGPLYKNGKKTRLKLSLEAWGHYGDKASAQAKGRRLLDQYKNSKTKKA